MLDSFPIENYGCYTCHIPLKNMRVCHNCWNFFCEEHLKRHWQIGGGVEPNPNFHNIMFYNQYIIRRKVIGDGFNNELYMKMINRKRNGLDSRPKGNESNATNDE